MTANLELSGVFSATIFSGWASDPEEPAWYTMSSTYDVLLGFQGDRLLVAPSPQEDAEIWVLEGLGLVPEEGKQVDLAVNNRGLWVLVENRGHEVDLYVGSKSFLGVFASLKVPPNLSFRKAFASLPPHAHSSPLGEAILAFEILPEEDQTGGFWFVRLAIDQKGELLQSSGSPGRSVNPVSGIVTQDPPRGWGPPGKTRLGADRSPASFEDWVGNFWRPLPTELQYVWREGHGPQQPPKVHMGLAVCVTLDLPQDLLKVGRLEP